MVELTDNGSPSDRNGMRYHELALQRWLNLNFHVVAGYPVPVVFTAPMDAFSYYSKMWATENSPFAYLYNAKDSAGNPLYEPYPAPARYPIISVHRRGWRIRQSQNYSIHRWRRLGWTTRFTSGTNLRDDIGNVLTAQMPQAVDFLYQIDFFCLRPDTLAVFVKHFMQKCRRTGGQNFQTWITVAYPFYGQLFSRLFVDGELAPMMPEEGGDTNQEYRVSIPVVVEGWEPDVVIQEEPVFWTLVVNGKTPSAVSPGELETVYTASVDMRSSQLTNNVMASRDNLPPYE